MAGLQKKGPAKKGSKHGQGAGSHGVSFNVWAALRAERQGGYSQPGYPQKEGAASLQGHNLGSGYQKF